MVTFGLALLIVGILFVLMLARDLRQPGTPRPVPTVERVVYLFTLAMACTWFALQLFLHLKG
ncbi:MAG TPA: hypothetical protein VK681_39000 [Reyranella sp.]|nr:hypothetical protein [Reyranella sp.]